MRHLRAASACAALALAGCTTIRTPYGTYTSSKDIDAQDLVIDVRYCHECPEPHLASVHIELGRGVGIASAVVAEYREMVPEITQAVVAGVVEGLKPGP